MSRAIIESRRVPERITANGRCYTVTERIDLDASIRTARRHAAEAAEAVSRQRSLIVKLREDGHETKSAEELLAQFEKLAAELSDHVSTLRRMQRADAATKAVVEPGSSGG